MIHAPGETLEDLPATVLAKYGGLCDRVEFSIPVETADDEALLAEMITKIQAG